MYIHVFLLWSTTLTYILNLQKLYCIYMFALPNSFIH